MVSSIVSFVPGTAFQSEFSGIKNSACNLLGPQKYFLMEKYFLIFPLEITKFLDLFYLKHFRNLIDGPKDKNII